MAGRHRLRKRRRPGLWILVALPVVVVGAMAYPAFTAPEEAPSASVAAATQAWQARTTTPVPTPAEEPTGPCAEFGGTMPHVAEAGLLLEERYPALKITSAEDGLEVWTSDVTLGWRVARYVMNNLDDMRALYVVYRSSVSFGDETWHAMRDQGDPTANHEDHLYVAFRSAAPGVDCPEEE